MLNDENLLCALKVDAVALGQAVQRLSISKKALAGFLPIAAV
jgi:hypothetical protein